MSEGSVRIELATGTVVQAENAGFIEVKEEQEYEPPKVIGSFGWAIERLKAGERLTRRGWNGKRQYIELASCISYRNPRGQVINVNHDAIGSNVIAFVGTSGTQIGWLASQSDMLAEDWELFV